MRWWCKMQPLAGKFFSPSLFISVWILSPVSLNILSFQFNKHVVLASPSLSCLGYDETQRLKFVSFVLLVFFCSFPYGTNIPEIMDNLDSGRGWVKCPGKSSIRKPLWVIFIKVIPLNLLLKDKQANKSILLMFKG